MGNCCCSCSGGNSCFCPLHEDAIIIDAPIDVVRQVFIDFDAWPEWNPLYKYVKVKRGDIQKLNTKVVLRAAVKFTPIPVKCIINADNNTTNKIEWHGSPISSCIQGFRVTNLFTKISETQTEFRRLEKWYGMLACFSNCCVGKVLSEKAQEMCVNLKYRCEKFQNLSKTLDIPIQSLFVPRNENDVRQIIATNLTQNSKNCIFRPYGGRHSWAPAVVSENDSKVVLLDTSQMKEPLKYVTVPTNDTTLHLLRMGPGVEPGQMAALAARNSRCLPETGALQLSIRIGGFLAAGCHGTGKDLPPVSEFVRALRMVVVNSTWFPNTPQNVGVVIFTDIPTLPVDLLAGALLIDRSHLGLDQSVNIMDYVRVHFGALGIVTEIFLDTVPNFFVDAYDEVLPLETVIPRPEQKDNSFMTDFYNTNTYLELFYSPFNELDQEHLPIPGRIWVKRANPIKKCCMSCYQCKVDILGFHENPFNNWLNDTVQANGDELESLLVDNPTPATPALLTQIGNLAYGLGLNPCCTGICGCIGFTCCEKTSHRYEVPFNQFSLYQRGSPESIIDCEMEVPMSFKRDPEALCFRRFWWWTVDRVRELAKEGKFPLNLTFHCRFNKCSKSLLSSCYSTDDEMRFATIEFLSVTGSPTSHSNYRSYLSEFRTEFMNKLLEINKTLPGSNTYDMIPRPHFAKDWYGIKDVEKKVGEVFRDNILTFNQVRQRVDPGGVFNGGLVPRLVAFAEQNPRK